jgi:hypothetical protein
MAVLAVPGIRVSALSIFGRRAASIGNAEDLLAAVDEQQPDVT